jgi:hypothetical protein
VPRLLLLVLVLLAALASGCARPTGRTAEVRPPEAAKYNGLLWHFLTATDTYDRALYVHDGEQLREEMECFHAGRPRAVRVRIVDVQGGGDDTATVTASVTYSDGSGRHVPVVVTKGDPAWLVDWRATRRGEWGALGKTKCGSSRDLHTFFSPLRRQPTHVSLYV